MDVKALAVKNYPKYWSKERIAYLVSIGRLTDEEYQEITVEEHKEDEPI